MNPVSSLAKYAFYAAATCLAVWWICGEGNALRRWIVGALGESQAIGLRALVFAPHDLGLVLLRWRAPELPYHHFYIPEFGPALYAIYGLAGVFAYRRGVLKAFTYITLIIHNGSALCVFLWLYGWNRDFADELPRMLPMLILFVGVQCLLVVAVNRISRTSGPVSFQFSLRSLLLLMAIVSVLSAYVATVASRVAESRRQLSKFEKYRERYEDGSIVALQLGIEQYRTELTESQSRDIAAIPRLRSLIVEYCDIEGAALERLATMPRLRHLALFGCSVIDREALFVPGLDRLESLELVGSAVTDDTVKDLSGRVNLRRLHIGGSVSNCSLRCLAKMTWLDELTLDRWELDDEGLEILDEMANLRKLRLICWNIKDDRLKAIARLERLRELEVSHTSEIAVEAFRRSRPDVTIIDSETGFRWSCIAHGDE